MHIAAVAINFDLNIVRLILIDKNFANLLKQIKRLRPTGYKPDSERTKPCVCMKACLVVATQNRLVFLL